MYKKFSLMSIAFFVSLFANSQRVVRNLSFEDFDTNGKLISWEFGNSNQQYTIAIDTSVSHSGNCSISISSHVKDSAERGAAGVFSILKAPNLHKKKKVRVSGYIKIDSLSDGIAVIALRLNGVKGPIGEASSNNIKIKKSLSWTKFIAELPLTFDVQSVTYGMHMTGLGKVWVDDFEIFVDDVLITDTIPLLDR